VPESNDDSALINLFVWLGLAFFSGVGCLITLVVWILVVAVVLLLLGAAWVVITTFL
jgi:hypothetical protein